MVRALARGNEDPLGALTEQDLLLGKRAVGSARRVPVNSDSGVVADSGATFAGPGTAWPVSTRQRPRACAVAPLEVARSASVATFRRADSDGEQKKPRKCGCCGKKR